MWSRLVPWLQRPSDAEGLPSGPSEALLPLLGMLGQEPGLVFEAGLRLLRERLQVDRAYLVRVTDLGLEATWWSAAEGLDPGPALRDPSQDFSPAVLENPTHILVIQDAREDARWREHPACAEHGVRAFLGVPFWEGEAVKGILSIQDSRPRAFAAADLALVSGVSNLFSLMLEIERLRLELARTQDALDFSRAVQADNSIESPVTRLPNLRYLHIWMKANLHLARRRGEPLALLRWHAKADEGHLAALRALAATLRGEDLLVDLGHAQFLLLLPRTAESGTGTVLPRIREYLGDLPLGATIWNPVWNPDREDRVLFHAMRRAELALHESRQRPGNPITWIQIEPELEEAGRALLEPREGASGVPDPGEKRE